MKVAVTYHEDFGKHGHAVLKNRVIPSFQALKELIAAGKVEVFEPQLSGVQKLVEKIHTPRHLQEVEYSGYYEVSLLSVASVVTAAELLAEQKFKRAFAYVGAAGHHASRNGFWGFCYLNDVAAAILRLREKGWKRFLILDVDPHFGDGTRDIFKYDRDVIHINFDTSTQPRLDTEFNNYDYGLGFCKDREFLAALEEALQPLYDFEMMIVIFGHDSHMRDYGGFSLSFDAYPALARKVKEYAGERPLLWVLSGGSEPEVAKQVIPDIIRVLTED